MIKTRIEKEREYLAYIDEHISTVKNVWLALQKHLTDCYWLDDCDYYRTDCYGLDDCDYYRIDDRISRHDQSKYDSCEFGGYRQFFYHVNENEKNIIAFNHAWNHHQKSNDHHWEYWLLIGKSGKIEALKMNLPSVIEMLCDWTAMSVKFKNIPSKWFDANKEKMVLHQDTIKTISHWLPIFDNVYNQMTAKFSEETGQG